MGDSGAFGRKPSGSPARRAIPAAWLLLGMAAACTPTVKVEAPKEPITINLNIQADVRVKLEEQAREDIQANPDVF